jgi:DNA-binding transcriptional ArsR family regulator
MSPIPAAERREIVAKLHATGLSADVIADALSVTPRTIRRDLTAAGLTPRRRDQVDVDDPHWMRKQLDQHKERIAQEATPKLGDLLAIAKLELIVQNKETFERLQEMTREP